MPALPLPVSAPKYVTVAEAIEGQIVEGKWEGGRMPSVRGIASEHKVSVVTASRALQVLRDKGLIHTIERSGCYRVPPPSAERWALCLRPTPGPWQRANVSIIRSGFESLARRQPMHLDFEAFALSEQLTAAAAQTAATAAREHDVQGVFLLPGRSCETEAHSEEAFLSGCKSAGLPVILLERNLRGRNGFLSTDLVCLDDIGGAAALTRHLFEIGRKRVGIVVASPTSTHNDRLAGYLYALHIARNAVGKRIEFPEVVIRQPAELPTKEAFAAVADVVVREELDGVVCYSDYVALALILEFLQRGLRVPKDVAVAGFDDLPVGELFAAGLTTFDYPAERVAEQAVRLMRERVKDPNRSPVKVVVPGSMQVRGSTVEA